MKGAPLDLAPPLLLYYDPPLSEVYQLLLESWRQRWAHEWAQAERCAQSAKDLCEQTDAASKVDLALAEIHLADLYGDVGEIEHAILLAAESCETLRRESAPEYRHYGAVAAYTLGLLYQLQFFGDSVQALPWYKQAVEQFKAAQDSWERQIMELKDASPLKRLARMLAAHFDEVELRTLCSDLGVRYDRLPGADKAARVEELVAYLDDHGRIPRLVTLAAGQQPTLAWDDLDWKGWARIAERITLLQQRRDRCQQAREWIGKRIEQLVQGRAAWPGKAILDIWPQDTAAFAQPDLTNPAVMHDEPFPASGRREGYILDSDSVKIGSDTYNADAAIEPKKDNYYFAIQVENNKLVVPGARPKDYLLIRQQWDIQGQTEEIKLGVIWQANVGWFAVDFVRESDKVKFYRRYVGRTTIGADTDPSGKIKGYVVAVLKRQ